MFIPRWRDVLGVGPVSVTTWGVLLAISLSTLLIVESYKYFRARPLAARIYQRREATERS
jgi:hypothetical protein